MACFRPIEGWRAPGGQVSFTGSGAWVDRPIQVPCGQCIGCRIEKSRQWAVRCVHEATASEASCFVTLTYSDHNLPADGSVDVREFQRFMKRLRKRVGSPIRFFHCGEYGDRTQRPHYHALLFGVDFASDRKRLPGRGPHPYYTSPTLDACWGLGHSKFSDVSYESAAYVARYNLKKITGDLAVEHYQGRRPEYATMSRKPGIGMPFIERYWRDVYRRDEVIVRGRSMKPPKAYDRWLADHHPDLWTEVRGKRVIAGRKHEHNNTWERLQVRERVNEGKARVFAREPD